MNHKVYLFGTKDFTCIPDSIINHIKAVIQQTGNTAEFIVGDNAGIDSAYQKALGSVGAFDNTTVYSLGDTKHNIFDFKTFNFRLDYYDEEKKLEIVRPDNGEIVGVLDKLRDANDIFINPSFYSTRDREMCRDCTFAICYWDNKDKVTLGNINMLKALNKTVYVYSVT